MSSYNNRKLSAPGMTATSNEWSALAFQGTAFCAPVFEGNFDAEIDAIAESVGDSGYFSNESDSFEASKASIASYNDRFPPADFECKSSLSSAHFNADISASNQPNRGSIFNGAPNKSTTHLEGVSSSRKREDRRISKTLYHAPHDYDHKVEHKYSTLESAGPSFALDQWVRTEERHERIAYPLEQLSTLQSSKRRKISGGQ